MININVKTLYNHIGARVFEDINNHAYNFTHQCNCTIIEKIDTTRLGTNLRYIILLLNSLLTIKKI